MKTGLEYSKEYFNRFALPSLKEYFPELFPRLAAGLVGNGSECFGYDDEISRDHDWGSDFFIWLREEDKDQIQKLAEWKMRLLSFSPPPYPRKRSEYGANIAIQTCGDFYRSLIGVTDVPDDILQWFRIPENNLAMCVNGEVFIDNDGAFTAVRQRLLSYYPEDFRLKKISAKCMAIAQTGQYNLERMSKRGEMVTVFSTLAKYIDSVTGLVFLLNRVYRPYYKWENRMLRSLPILGQEISCLLCRLTEASPLEKDYIIRQKTTISSICKMLLQELHNQGLTSSDDWFFSTHGEEVRKRISHGVLRSLPATYE